MCSFLLLLEVFRIRLIGICARFGAGSGSHFWVVPPFCLRISFNLFFFACKRKMPFSIILRTLGRRVKRAGAAYTVLTILTVPINFFVALGCRQKSLYFQGLRRFCACFFVVFWYTIIARVVYNYCTFGTQKSHVLLWLYIYAYNAFTVFGYCVAFYKSFGFPIIKYGRRIFPYASFFGFGGV